jgi:hypothetical protein
MNSLARLQPNMIVRFEAREWRVALVNESRALLVPRERVVRVFVPETGPNAGKEVRVAAIGTGISVSPNSELPIVQWPGLEVAA